MPHFEEVFKLIIVNDYAWICTGAIITQEVEGGKGAVVAAESSVTKNVGDYKIVGGCPARIIGRRKPGLIITLESTFLY